MRIPIATYLREHGFSDAQIRIYERYSGFSEIPMAPELQLSDQMLAAAAKLNALRGQEDRVRYVLQARTLPIVTPYPVNPLHKVCQALGLAHNMALSVTQHACASGLLAVDLAGKLLAAEDPDGLVLIFLGEKSFTSAARVIA